MRKILIIACASLMACACFAGPKSYYLSCPMGTNTAANFTFGGDPGITMEVADIYVSCSDSVSTGTVGVLYSPAVSNVSDIVMATNSVAGSKVFRPSVDRTGADGADLTTDPPGRHLLVHESVLVSISGSPTGKVWTVTLKGED